MEAGKEKARCSYEGDMMQLNKKIEKVFLVIEDFTDRIFHYGRISQCSNNNQTNNYMIKYNTYYKIYIRI